MEPFSLLLKPVSFRCNLNCRYCFYLPKQELFGAAAHRMSAGTLEAVVRSYLSCPMEQYQFGWQGGEPTLAGVGFYRQAVEFQRRYGRNAAIFNALQTNGTRLDDEWGRFLHENRFLTGISIDGPAALHDRYRCYADGRGSHAEAVRGLGVLKRHRVEYNVLTLVSAANQEHPLDVYHYLREQGVRFQQYIDCVEFDRSGCLQPFALTPGKWGEFLCRIFDEWYRYDTMNVSIRLFDSILSRLTTGVPTVCPMSGNCCNYLVTEYNGDVFPCDFHVQPEYRLGNIRRTGFGKLWNASSFRNWGQNKEPHSERCASCRYLPLCMGDCPKNRGGGCSVLCRDWQLFYSHTIERFEKLAAVK